MTKSSSGSDSEQRKKKVITLTLLAILLMSVSLFLTGPKESDTIIVEFPGGKKLETEVASTPEKLLFGLAFREGLPRDTGMLYIFESTGLHRVRTRQYKIPVDMMWVDESHHVIQLLENVPPCAQDPCPLYGPPPEPVRYLIQTDAGYVRREGVTAGMELKFTLRM
ncbi:MAG: DUF192 domain-containing protein [Nitrospiraceae bacterium]|nr:DUF192 domain-containing protein [Nitrospiraceae bacterium]